MKKALIVIALILSLIVVSIGAFFATLKTEYGAPTANWFLQEILKQPIQIEAIDINQPYRITLQGIEIPSPEPFYIQKADLWLNPTQLLQGQLAFDSVLLDGLSLQRGAEHFSPQQYLSRSNIAVNQLAIHNLDYAQGDLSSRGINVQIKDPQWISPTQIVPFGEIQLAAEQIYWQGEAIDGLLIDAKYQAHDSTVYGASFQWRDAKVSGQAEQFNQDWSLINVTIDGLRLNSQQMQSLNSKPWPFETARINHINSLDILRSDIQWQEWHLVGFDASFENLQLPFEPWRQKQGTFSLQADSVSMNDEQWVSPNFNVLFNRNQIDVIDFVTVWKQGRIQLSGFLTPTKINLDSLSLQGLKWIAEDKAPDIELPYDFSQLQTVSIQELDIARSQFIQLISEPYWQISGLEVEGDNLQLMSQGKVGLWKGSLRAAVNNASYDSVITSHALAEMQSEQGQWQLTRLFAPLADGYIEAEASLDFSSLSQPWQLLVTADGIPTQPLFSRLELPFTLHGLSEFELRAHGLIGDQTMLAHSLTGKLMGSIRNAGVEILSTEEQQTDAQPVKVSDIQLNMDRGRIALQDINITGLNTQGQLGGKLDLLSSEPHQLPIEVKQECFSLSGNLMTREYDQKTECVEPSTTHSVSENDRLAE